MSEKLDLEKMPDNALQRMFDNRTTDEVVADIVAAEPEKHGVTVAERLRRAKAEVIFDDTELAEESAIRAVGGDPFEFMPGNRPRWTVSAGVIHDHMTGAKLNLTGQQQGMATLSSPVQTGAVAAPTQQEILDAKDHETGEHPSRDQSDGQATQIDSGRRTIDGAETVIAVEQGSGETDGRFGGGIDFAEASDGDEKITGGVFGSDGKVYTFQEWDALQKAQCDHDFGEDPQESTPCAKCGLTFYAWAVA